MPRITAILIILSLAACGMKGPLEMPQPKAKPAAAADLSTPRSATAR